MKDKKYLFLIDVDNTLVKRGNKVIAPQIIEKIKQLQSQGHIFVISTGRALHSLLAIQGAKKFDYLAVLFGNRVVDTKNFDFIYRGKNFDYDTIYPLIKYLQDNNINWEYKTEDGQKTISDDEAYLNRTIAKKIPYEEYQYDLDSNNMIQLLVDGHINQTIQSKHKALDFFLMPENYTDVSLVGADKSQCVKFFRQKFPDYITVSIGDSENDIPMFDTTDISIAMGNSKDDIKQRTTYVTKDLNDDGLIYAFTDILKL